MDSRYEKTARQVAYEAAYDAAWAKCLEETEDSEDLSSGDFVYELERGFKAGFEAEGTRAENTGRQR